jgi:hypothetical protein
MRDPKRGTQARIILELLRERGSTGVGAREAVYDLGITRMASIVYDLRKKRGYHITTIESDGPMARYVLTEAPPKRKTFPRPCRCGHFQNWHLVKIGPCQADVSDRLAPTLLCPCTRYTEAQEGIHDRASDDGSQRAGIDVLLR